MNSNELNNPLITKILKQYRDQYCLWDPALVFNGEYWFLYALAAEQEVNAENYFMVYSYIHGFRSTDLENWEDLGPVITSAQDGQTMCAAIAVVEDQTVYLFYSKTVQAYSDYHLDQRVFLAKSDNGKDFTEVDDFSLPPDKKQYETQCYHPQTNEMLFAWRDPYVLKDPKTGLYYAFVCAGGFRWGVAPNIAIATCETIDGNYRALAPAIYYETDVNGSEIIPIPELERPQVIFHNNKYYLYLSCYLKHMNPSFVKECEARGIQITDSCRYQFVADHIEGPYRLDQDKIMIESSAQTDLYCGLFARENEHSPFVMVGWNTERFELEVRQDHQLVMDDTGGKISKHL